MKKIGLLLFMLLIIISCNNSVDNNNITKKTEIIIRNKVEDSLETVIGNQIWMTYNLDVKYFRNGDPIPEVKTLKEWQKIGGQGKPAFCYYLNNPANEVKYGLIYNWYAVNDPRGISPIGWHIPSSNEWESLISFLGDRNTAGTKLKCNFGWPECIHLTDAVKKLDEEELWQGSGTNESHFRGIASPGRNSYDFDTIIHWSNWWTSTERDKETADMYALRCYDEGVIDGSTWKEFGLSVRCIKN